jgi:excisionase family DNA binding protein
MTTANRSELQPLAYSIAEATRVAPIGRTRIYQLIAEGKLEARKLGNRTIIPAHSLHRLIQEGC